MVSPSSPGTYEPDLMILRSTIPTATRLVLVLSGFLHPIAAVMPHAPVNAVETHVPPAHKRVEPIATMISKGEGDWNAVNRGRAGDTPGGFQDLLGDTCENFTVGEILDMQAAGRIYAVGRYQFIPTTLRFAVEQSGVSRLDFFSPVTQNKLLVALLQHKRPAVWEYLTGKGTVNAALDALAKEWASIATKSGRTYYVGTSNAAHVTRDEARIALEQARALF